MTEIFAIGDVLPTINQQFETVKGTQGNYG